MKSCGLISQPARRARLSAAVGGAVEVAEALTYMALCAWSRRGVAAMAALGGAQCLPRLVSLASGQPVPDGTEPARAASATEEVAVAVRDLEVSGSPEAASCVPEQCEQVVGAAVGFWKVLLKQWGFSVFPLMASFAAPGSPLQAKWIQARRGALDAQSPSLSEKRVRITSVTVSTPTHAGLRDAPNLGWRAAVHPETPRLERPDEPRDTAHGH